MLAKEMELRHLRYFIAVAEEENVSRAALKLHVSQPAVSRQIRDLEEELGFQLFERSAKSISLTPAGQVFLSEARAVIARAEQAVTTARATAAGNEEIQVGYAPSPTVRILPATLRSFQTEWPKARVKLHDLSSEEMFQQLHGGKLDIAFVVRPNAGRLRGLVFEELARMSICLAVARGHALARARKASLKQVAEFPLITLSRKDYPDYNESLAQLFRKEKLKLRVAEEHDSITSLVAAVEAGSGVALVSESVACIAGPRLKFIPVFPAPPRVVVGAAWRKDKLSLVAGRFLESAKNAVSQLNL